MALYGDLVVPYICDLAMRNRHLRSYRARVAGAAEGVVLEIGVGSGLNFPFYGPQAREVVALEPAPRLVAMARRAAHTAVVPVRFLEASAEAIPLEDASADTVVTSWTLCSVPRALAALSEMRRVLKPAGRLLFVEHGRAPDASVRHWQDRLTPLWRRLSGGCHLNRPIGAMIAEAGFRIERLETGYVPGPKPMTYFYEGAAVPR